MLVALLILSAPAHPQPIWIVRDAEVVIVTACDQSFQVSSWWRLAFNFDRII